MSSEEGNKFVVYRDVEDGYGWRLRSAAGETPSAPSEGHRDEHSCYEEIRKVMAGHPTADILNVAVE